jgi:microcystin-dependent protein
MPTFVVGTGTGDNYGVILLPVIDVEWFKSALFGALFELAFSPNWVELGDVAVSFAVEESAKMIDGYQFMNFNPVPIAKIDAFCLQTPPDGWLPCDGAGYAEADYPELYAAIDPIFIDTDTHMVYTPRIFPGQTVIQFGTASSGDEFAFSQNDEGTRLDIEVENLPEHSHTIPLTATTLAVEPGEVTVMTPIPFFTDNTGMTGGGEYITRMTPYMALSYFIYAGRI